MSDLKNLADHWLDGMKAPGPEAYPRVTPTKTAEFASLTNEMIEAVKETKRSTSMDNCYLCAQPIEGDHPLVDDMHFHHTCHAQMGEIRGWEKSKVSLLASPRTFGYARVSREDLAKNVTADDVTEQINASLMGQGSDMEGYYQRTPNLPPLQKPIIADAGVSGMTEFRARPNGGQLWRMLQPGDHLIVTKADRLFRNLTDMLATLKRLESMSVTLHIINFNEGMGLSTGTIWGKLLLVFLGFVAEMEWHNTRERYAAGRRRMKKLGLPPNGKNPPGKILLDGKMVETGEAKVCEYVWGLARKYSYRNIAAHLNELYCVYRKVDYLGRVKKLTYYDVLGMHGTQEEAMNEAVKKGASWQKGVITQNGRQWDCQRVFRVFKMIQTRKASRSTMGVGGHKGEEAIGEKK